MGDSAASLQSRDYVRERQRPEPGDSAYLLLSDLRIAIERLRIEGRVRVLDYGCGGSPYRDLFLEADYRRADTPAMGALDYLLDGTWAVREEDGRFDVVLSTQVLEHVSQPQAYLREANRLLRSGGWLVCSTHGSFPDHGCPDDYHRWTADGLVQELRGAGFEATEAVKVTTDGRALFFMLDTFVASLGASRRTAFGWVLWVLRRLVVTRRASMHRLVDRHFPGCRVVPANEGARLYVGLACRARKTAS